MSYADTESMAHKWRATITRRKVSFKVALSSLKLMLAHLKSVTSSYGNQQLKSQNECMTEMLSDILITEERERTSKMRAPKEPVLSKLNNSIKYSSSSLRSAKPFVNQQHNMGRHISFENFLGLANTAKASSITGSSMVPAIPPTGRFSSIFEGVTKEISVKSTGFFFNSK